MRRKQTKIVTRSDGTVGRPLVKVVGPAERDSRLIAGKQTVSFSARFAFECAYKTPKRDIAFRGAAAQRFSRNIPRRVRFHTRRGCSPRKRAHTSHAAAAAGTGTHRSACIMRAAYHIGACRRQTQWRQTLYTYDTRARSYNSIRHFGRYFTFCISSGFFFPIRFFSPLAAAPRYDPHERHA